MSLNRVKLERAVIFMIYLAGIVPLIFLAKNSVWNKIMFPTSNSLNLAELVVNEPMKSICKNLQVFLSLFYLSLLSVKISRAHN